MVVADDTEAALRAQVDALRKLQAQALKVLNAFGVTALVGLRRVGAIEGHRSRWTAGCHIIFKEAPE